MKSLSKFAFVTVLGAATWGCASDKLGGGDDDPSDPIPDDNDPPPPPPELSATGTYRLHSRFDLAQNMPGTVGGAVNGLIAMTDDPNDPAHWVLTQLIDQLPDGFLKDLLVASEPFVASELNQELIDLAPELVNTLLDVGQLVADIAKNFGLGETLVVGTDPDGRYTGALTIDAFELDIAGTPANYKFSDYQIADINATSLPVTLDATRKLSIGQHQFPVSYGHVLRIALDEGIIPAIDPSAQDLGDLLAGVVDCAAVGQAVADALGFGGSAIYAGACTLGLDAAAAAMYDQIAGIDGSALEFDIQGISNTVDANTDYKVDRLENGVWSGTLGYAGTVAPLGTATYNGVRIEQPQ